MIVSDFIFLFICCLRLQITGARSCHLRVPHNRKQYGWSRMCVGSARNYETLPHKTQIISQSRCSFSSLEGSKTRQVENLASHDPRSESRAKSRESRFAHDRGPKLFGSAGVCKLYFHIITHWTLSYLDSGFWWWLTVVYSLPKHYYTFIFLFCARGT